MVYWLKVPRSLLPAPFSNLLPSQELATKRTEEQSSPGARGLHRSMCTEEQGLLEALAFLCAYRPIPPRLALSFTWARSSRNASPVPRMAPRQDNASILEGGKYEFPKSGAEGDMIDLKVPMRPEPQRDGGVESRDRAVQNLLAAEREDFDGT